MSNRSSQCWHRGNQGWGHSPEPGTHWVAPPGKLRAALHQNFNAVRLFVVIFDSCLWSRRLSSVLHLGNIWVYTQNTSGCVCYSQSQGTQTMSRGKSSVKHRTGATELTVQIDSPGKFTIQTDNPGKFKIQTDNAGSLCYQGENSGSSCSFSAIQFSFTQPSKGSFSMFLLLPSAS